MQKTQWTTFLWDVFICALGSYGGPEAHYGVFSQILVERKKYLTEEDLSELIGIYSLVPGPGSTQTITAIGHLVGGPILAWLTFMVWALPAIAIMALIGVFFTHISANDQWMPVLTYLPHAAVAFIIFAAIRLSSKVIGNRRNRFLYLIMLVLSFVFMGQSIWSVPILLVIAGLTVMAPQLKDQQNQPVRLSPNWTALILLLVIAVANEITIALTDASILNLFASFFRYGYSAMGGGQVVIPLMISDLVDSQSLISLEDFLAGYAIDQAVPGPLFSFAAFVSARAMAGSGFSFLAGMIGGLAIFLPGILLVFFMFPLWKSMRDHTLMKFFLKGVTVAVASLITATAIQSTLALDFGWVGLGLTLVGTLLLLSKKVPAPLIVLLAAILGFIA